MLLVFGVGAVESVAVIVNAVLASSAPGNPDIVPVSLSNTIPGTCIVISGLMLKVIAPYPVPSTIVTGVAAVILIPMIVDRVGVASVVSSGVGAFTTITNVAVPMFASESVTVTV